MRKTQQEESEARIITQEIIKPVATRHMLTRIRSTKRLTSRRVAYVLAHEQPNQATGLFRRVTDCLMVDCRALLRGSSDWVAAKHLAVSRGAPRRQSSYNREVILRKMSSSSGTSDENGGSARATEIPTATSKETCPSRK